MKKSYIIYIAFVLLAIIVPINNCCSQDYIHISRITDGLNAPLRLAIDNQNNIYITDAYQKNIVKYDASGNFLGTIETGGIPVSIAISSDNLIVFGDSKSGNLIKINPDGSLVLLYTDSIYPSSMVISPDNFLYVVDNLSKQVIVLDLNGNYISTFGKGILSFPTGIAYNHYNNRILVAEHGGTGTGFSLIAEVKVFDLTGNLINTFGSYGNGDGEFYRIQGLTIGKCGNIYISDPYQSGISVFDENGSFISRFGEFGTGEGQLNLPIDIAFNSQEEILITSLNNGALEIYNIADSLPSSNIKCNNPAICGGIPASIEISFTGTAPWTFSYTKDGYNPTTVRDNYDNPYLLDVLDEGVYEIVSLSDAAFEGTCFSGKVEITNGIIPTSSIVSSDVSICAGEFAEIVIEFTGTAPWTFTYTIDGLNPKSIITPENPYILSTNNPGLYELTSLSGSNCKGVLLSESVSINRNSNPLPTSSFTVGNVIIPSCLKDTVILALELTGEAPWNITYTIDDKNPTTINNIANHSCLIAASLAGVYDVKSVSDIHCTNYFSTGFPEIEINSIPINLGPDTIICSDETITLTPGYAYTKYLWSDESTKNSLLVSKSGNYSVTVIDDYNCEIIDSIYVKVEDLPVADFSYSVDRLEVSFMNNSQNASSYYWGFGDCNYSANANPIHTYAADAEYIVSLKALSGNCGDSTLSKSITITSILVDSVASANSITIFPNPSTGFIKIAINNNYQAELAIQVARISGEIVYCSIINAKQITNEIDLSYLSTGIYNLKLTGNDFTTSTKLIITK